MAVVGAGPGADCRGARLATSGMMSLLVGDGQSSRLPCTAQGARPRRDDEAEGGASASTAHCTQVSNGGGVTYLYHAPVRSHWLSQLSAVRLLPHSIKLQLWIRCPSVPSFRLRSLKNRHPPGHEHEKFSSPDCCLHTYRQFSQSCNIIISSSAYTVRMGAITGEILLGSQPVEYSRLTAFKSASSTRGRNTMSNWSPHPPGRTSSCSSTALPASSQIGKRCSSRAGN